MLLPILIAASMLSILWVAKANPRNAVIAQLTAGKSLPAPSPISKLRTFLRMTQKPPPRWMVNEAIREAFDRGDYVIVARLTHAFEPSNPEPSNPEPCPPGVSLGEWEAFTDALKTHPPEHRDTRHIGAYHQNTERLSQLGINGETLSTLDNQSSALTRDMSDYIIKEKTLLRDACGDVVNIQGTPHGVTMSGVLGLLKSAGPKNARSWLRSEAERSAFPHTTETFLRTNGIF